MFNPTVKMLLWRSVNLRMLMLVREGIMDFQVPRSAWHFYTWAPPKQNKKRAFYHRGTGHLAKKKKATQG